MVPTKDSHMNFSPLSLVLCTTSMIMLKITSQLSSAFTSIRDSLADSQQSMLYKQHQRTKPHEIEVGDIVFTRVQDRYSKLDPLFNGPHCVIEIMAGHKVKLCNLRSGSENLVHRDHLKSVDLTVLTVSHFHPPSHPYLDTSFGFAQYFRHSFILPFIPVQLFCIS